MKIQKNKTVVMISILLNVAMPTIAQDVNLSYSDGNVTLPLDTNSSMTVDPVSGDINVVTSFSSEDIGNELGLQPTGSAPVIDFTITENNTTSADVSATVSNDAVYCNKTVAWSGLTQSNPPVSYVTSVVENGVTDNGTYTLTCANTFGKTTNSGVVDNIVVVNPATLTLSANPTSVTSGQSSTLTWVIGNNPTSCTKSGDWPDNGVMPAQDITNGTHQQVITNITQSMSFSMICSNTAGSSGTKVASVTVSGGTGSTWPSCAGSAASILGGAEDRSILATFAGVSPGTYNGKYEEIFNTTNPVAFPGDVGLTMYLSITRNQYVAAQFNSGTPGRYARYSLNPPGNDQGPLSSATTITISECPGDFNVHLGQSTCKSNGSATGSLYWSDMPDANPSLFCKIDRNKTYYLNIVHSNDTVNNYQVSGCDSSNSYCGLIMTLRSATNPQ
ncbi:MAG: hypothetical protein R3F25_07850 [Gammaproteobacteria bacterium]|jgi:hypothetical protein|nr:hypothetical protein [Xanthomonadales bacterium]